MTLTMLLIAPPFAVASAAVYFGERVARRLRWAPAHQNPTRPQPRNTNTRESTQAPGRTVRPAANASARA